MGIRGGKWMKRFLMQHFSTNRNMAGCTGIAHRNNPMPLQRATPATDDVQVILTSFARRATTCSPAPSIGQSSPFWAAPRSCRAALAHARCQAAIPALLSKLHRLTLSLLKHAL